MQEQGSDEVTATPGISLPSKISQRTQACRSYVVSAALRDVRKYVSHLKLLLKHGDQVNKEVTVVRFSDFPDSESVAFFAPLLAYSQRSGVKSDPTLIQDQVARLQCSCLPSPIACSQYLGHALRSF
jgi:hypothetical protein